VSIGVIGSFSGAFGSTIGGAEKVLNAWKQDVNASGGLQGRPVQLTVDDVGSAPAGTDLIDAKQLISQHVVAIIDVDLQDTTWVKTATAAGIPVLAANDTASSYMTPDVFPVELSIIPGIYASLYEAKTLGAKTGIVYASEEGAAVQQEAAIFKVFAGAVGEGLPVFTSVSASSPDFTAVCQELKTAGVSSYTLIFPAAVQQKVTDQCYQQGLRIPQLLYASNSIPQWLSDKAYNDSLVMDGITPSFETSVPGVKAYRAALQKYEPSLVGSGSDNDYAALSWLAGQVIQTAAAKISGAVTATSLLNAVQTFKGETLNGGTSPLTYTAGQINPVRCWFTYTISGGKNVGSAASTTPTCASPQVVGPFDSALAKQVGG
jgi:branched-chain amino acid transport system substrate-binding protein